MDHQRDPDRGHNTAPVSPATPPAAPTWYEELRLSISYQVDDADGDDVTVTEKMDSTTKRSYEATLEATNQFQVTAPTSSSS